MNMGNNILSILRMLGIGTSIIVFMYLMWVIMSIVFLIDPGNPYNN